jgi:hypothetical protein
MRSTNDADLIKIYRLPIEIQIVLSLIGILMAVGGLVLLGLVVFISATLTKIGAITLLLLGLLLLPLGIWMLALAILAETTLYRNRIVQRSIFSSCELLGQDIRGYQRLQGKAEGIQLLPSDSRLKPIDVSLLDAKTPEFAGWLKAIPNLDGSALIDADELEVDCAITQDASLGATPEERKAKARMMRTTVNILTGGYIVVVGVVSFIPSLAWLYMTLFVLMPWIAISLVARSPQNYTILERDKKALLRKADLLFLVSAPTIFAPVAMQRMLEVNQPLQAPAHFLPLLLLSITCGLAMLGLIAAISTGIKPKILAYLGFWFAFSIYAAQSLGMVNCFFDFAEAKNYQLVINQKHQSKGRRTSNQLVVKSIDASYSGSTQLTVPLSLYNAVQVNDTICAQMHLGFLKMEWESISLCPAQ